MRGAFNAEPVPATVLDPFSGAGTTGLVALRLNRNAILIDLKEEYCQMAAERIPNEAPPPNLVGPTASPSPAPRMDK